MAYLAMEETEDASWAEAYEQNTEMPMFRGSITGKTIAKQEDAQQEEDEASMSYWEEVSSWNEEETEDAMCSDAYEQNTQGPETKAESKNRIERCKRKEDARKMKMPLPKRMPKHADGTRQCMTRKKGKRGIETP